MLFIYFLLSVIDFLKKLNHNIKTIISTDRKDETDKHQCLT